MITQPLAMGRIDYINASPVYYGLDNGLLPDWLTMVDGPPAVLNRMIQQEELAISPVSSAFYGLHHQDLLVLPNLSISSNSKVLSVILMTEVPLEELHGRTVVLTRESATSVLLVKMILKKKGIQPVYVTGPIRNLSDIPPQAGAALIIGDAALTQPWNERFFYRWDLGELWKEMTGKPFVFALWVVRRAFALENPSAVRKSVKLLHLSRESGYRHMPEIIEKGAGKLGLSKRVVEDYYNHLFCDLDSEKEAGVNLFFDSLHRLELFPEKAEVTFFDD